jgi:hypothetical protein
MIIYFSLERLNRMTAEAIMDLYPEVLDPEYDSKKKKQRVKFFIQIFIYSFFLFF